MRVVAYRKSGGEHVILNLEHISMILYEEADPRFSPANGEKVYEVDIYMHGCIEHQQWGQALLNHVRDNIYDAAGSSPIR